MTDISFYHLTQTSMESALPDLLEKTLQKGWRAVVMAGSPERVEALTQHLWSYKPDYFLPHGCAKDGYAEQQPIWLTAEDERPNQADVLFLTDGADSTRHSDYTRVCYVFDGNDPTAVTTAREKWAQCKERGYHLSYWQQGERGWQKAA